MKQVALWWWHRVEPLHGLTVCGINILRVVQYLMNFYMKGCFMVLRPIVRTSGFIKSTKKDRWVGRKKEAFRSQGVGRWSSSSAGVRLNWFTADPFMDSGFDYSIGYLCSAYLFQAGGRFLMTSFGCPFKSFLHFGHIYIVFLRTQSAPFGDRWLLKKMHIFIFKTLHNQWRLISNIIFRHSGKRQFSLLYKGKTVRLECWDISEVLSSKLSNDV